MVTWLCMWQEWMRGLWLMCLWLPIVHLHMRRRLLRRQWLWLRQRLHLCLLLWLT
jgi:hypothetical protein